MNSSTGPASSSHIMTFSPAASATAPKGLRTLDACLDTKGKAVHHIAL